MNVPRLNLAARRRRADDPARMAAIRGAHLALADEYDAAREQFAEARRLNPLDAPILQSAGTLEMSLGNMAAARDLLERAVHTDVTLASAWANLVFVTDHLESATVADQRRVRARWWRALGLSCPRSRWIPGVPTSTLRSPEGITDPWINPHAPLMQRP